MKRTISLMLIPSILCMLCFPASGSVIEDDSVCGLASVSSETIESMLDMPIYITDTEGIDELSDEERGAITSAVKEDIVEGLANDSDIVDFTSDAGTLINQSTQFGIYRLTENQKQNILSSPINASTINRIQEIIDGGNKVEYINFFVRHYPQDSVASVMSANSNADSAEYWESNYPRLGTYGGYTFLYTETSVGVETPQVTPGNLNGSVSWKDVIDMSLTVFVDQFVNATFYQAIRVGYSVLSVAFNLYQSPLQISFEPSRDYLKAQVSGDLYIRTILLSDNKDRHSGYAYYTWGSTEKLTAAVRLDGKYPTYRYPSGVYEYEYPSYTAPKASFYTVGFSGTTALYTSIINRYENYTIYSIHDEYIDVQSVVASLVS